MNISYNWLKEYVNFDLTPDETAAALTSIGLETGGVEEVQTIKDVYKRQVLICSNVVISLIKNLIPDMVRIPSFIVVIASFVT